MKRTIRLLASTLVAGIVFFGLHLFCESQTKGFRYYWLLSNLPNDPKWEVPPLNNDEQQNINHLLDQRFHYLGSGGWCIAFLGEDQKTVLKFFRHIQFLPERLFENFSFKKLLLQSDRLPQEAWYFQEFNFKSCTLLYNTVKERTGILYLHLNKTNGLHKPVTLIDNLGISHTLDLDQTEFVVQKRAHLLLPHIDTLVKQNKTEEAKHCLDDMIACLLTLNKSGARDLDHSLRNNFGFTDDGAITLDLSSYAPDESLRNPGEYRKELIVKTRRLSRHLEKNHEELYRYFEARLSEIVENG